MLSNVRRFVIHYYKRDGKIWMLFACGHIKMLRHCCIFGEGDVRVCLECDGRN